jgi:hypothetical protein
MTTTITIIIDQILEVPSPKVENDELQKTKEGPPFTVDLENGNEMLEAEYRKLRRMAKGDPDDEPVSA